MRALTHIRAGGNGVVNVGSGNDFRPTTGELVHRFCLGSHFDLTRSQHNDVRAAAVTAGGMNDLTAAYAAVKTAMASIDSDRGGWLDHYTTGRTSTETEQTRRATVWHFVARGEIPSPPSP